MKLKKMWVFGMLTVLMLLFLTACQTAGDSADTPDEPGISAAGDPVQLPAQTGTTETFSYGDLRLTVTNVLEKRIDCVFDGMENCEYEVYVVAPGAVATVLDADMMGDTVDGQPHADWAFLLDPAAPNREGGRLDIVDGMEPVEITLDILGVYDPESSLYVLQFQVQE